MPQIQSFALSRCFLEGESCLTPAGRFLPLHSNRLDLAESSHSAASTVVPPGEAMARNRHQAAPTRACGKFFRWASRARPGGQGPQRSANRSPQPAPVVFLSPRSASVVIQPGSAIGETRSSASVPIHILTGERLRARFHIAPRAAPMGRSLHSGPAMSSCGVISFSAAMYGSLRWMVTKS